MLCECHGLPAGWQKDKRVKAGGYWECRVRRQKYNRARMVGPRHERILAQYREYWHRADGGYIKERKRDLARQRERIALQLKAIEEEILESQP